MKRNQIFERDGYRCVYCGECFADDELSVDHVQPRVRGGDHSGGNLVTACKGCNTLKGARRVGAFLRDVEGARVAFFRYATHVWPRILREVQREMDEVE